MNPQPLSQERSRSDSGQGYQQTTKKIKIMANTTICIVRKYKEDGLYCLLFPEDTCKGQTPFCSNEINHALYCWGEADYRTMIALTNPANEEEAAGLIATAQRDENQHGDGRTFVFRKRYKFAH